MTNEAPPMVDHKRPRFDPTINLGHLLTMATLAIAMVMGWAKLDTRLTLVEAQLSAMVSLMERAIRTEEQVRSLEKRVERVEGR